MLCCYLYVIEFRDLNMKRAAFCIDRNGTVVPSYDLPKGLFRFLYGCAAGRLMLRWVVKPKTSARCGRLLDSRFSKTLIRPFIRKSGINMAEYIEEKYKSFNDFFCRTIREGARPIDRSEKSIVSPCDGKVQAFSIAEDSTFTIKGIDYSMRSLLRDPELAGKYCGGTLMLFRLSVDDYHHYCYPVDGIEDGSRVLQGVFHTVNPVAAAKKPVYCENSREYSILETEKSGDILLMEVGALSVGKIINLRREGLVKKGEEKGHFAFGASSIILCFEKDAVIPDSDIFLNTLRGCETVVKMGTQVASIVR